MDTIQEIIFSKLYHIDNDLNRILKKELAEEDAIGYVRRVINDLIITPNTRKCVFNSSNSMMESLICKIIEQNNEAAFTTRESTSIDITEMIAKKLLKAEVQAKIHESNLNMKITKGSLLQSLIVTEEGYVFIIAKIEHETFIDGQEMKSRYGLPTKKITLKSCKISMDEDFNILEVKVSDSSNSIAKYWLDGFLDLVTYNNNIDTTKKIYSGINRVLSKYLKGKSPRDFKFVQEKVNHYMKSQQEYVHTNMVDYLLNEYYPEEGSNINITELRENLEVLPIKLGLDSHFVIDKNSIIKKVVNQIKLRDGINLSYEGDPEEIKRKVKSKLEEGIKKLEIYEVEDAVFDYFRS